MPKIKISMKFIERIEKIEDLKTEKLHKPGLISSYHNFPAIIRGNNA